MPPAADEERCDPRVERTRRRVLEAVIDVLAEEGYAGLTVEGIAARSGVAKSTIYRHWTGRAELADAAIRLLKPVAGPAATGTVRQRVAALLRDIAVATADTPWARCLPAIIDAAERDPQLKALHHRTTAERRRHLHALLVDGMESGELDPTPDLELLADSLVGPVFLRRLFTGTPFTPRDAATLVEMHLGRDP